MRESGMGEFCGKNREMRKRSQALGRVCAGPRRRYSWPPQCLWNRPDPESDSRKWSNFWQTSSQKPWMTHNMGLGVMGAGVEGWKLESTYVGNAFFFLNTYVWAWVWVLVSVCVCLGGCWLWECGDHTRVWGRSRPGVGTILFLSSVCVEVRGPGILVVRETQTQRDPV